MLFQRGNVESGGVLGQRLTLTASVGAFPNPDFALWVRNVSLETCRDTWMLSAEMVQYDQELYFHSANPFFLSPHPYTLSEPHADHSWR